MSCVASQANPAALGGAAIRSRFPTIAGRAHDRGNADGDLPAAILRRSRDRAEGGTRQ